MSNAEIIIFLKTLAVIGTLLMIGTYLRAKVRVLQALFLPACVIGGFIALILGPNCLGVLPISAEIMTTASKLPSKLFGIVIAALPMCAAKMKKGEWSKHLDAVNLGIIITLVSAAQIAVGFLVNVLFSIAGKPLYYGYGTEMFMAYCGGHGVAVMVGSLFTSLGQDYGDLASGVGLTFATIGLIGGIMLGVFVLNRAARRGETRYVTNPSELPREMRVGLYENPADCPSAGKQTTAGGAIDTLGLHFGFIMMDVGIGYIIYDIIKKLNIPYLKDMDAWLYILFAMYGLWAAVRKLGWDKHFDPAIKNKIQGGVADFIITAAIMTMPLSLLLEYWLPILITSILGFIVTIPTILLLCKYYMSEDKLEKSMGPIGMMTGDFITGVLLTKMADPDLKSNALGDFSIAYSINTIYCVSMLAIMYPVAVNYGPLNSMFFALAQMVALGVLLLFFGRLARKAQND